MNLKGGKMIRNREEKIAEIIETITGGLPQVINPNEIGPSLYFYRRVMDLRRTYNSVSDFLLDINYG